MRTYIADIIPKIQQYSQKLDNITLLTNQHWIVLDEMSHSKTVYIFRSNSELLISKNGKVTKAKWELIGNNSLLIDMGVESFLMRQGFFDENILALKSDGKTEFALLVNETRLGKEIRTVSGVLEFLQKKYLLNSYNNIEKVSPQLQKNDSTISVSRKKFDEYKYLIVAIVLFVLFAVIIKFLSLPSNPTSGIQEDVDFLTGLSASNPIKIIDVRLVNVFDSNILQVRNDLDPYAIEYYFSIKILKRSSDHNKYDLIEDYFFSDGTQYKINNTINFSEINQIEVIAKLSRLSNNGFYKDPTELYLYLKRTSDNKLLHNSKISPYQKVDFKNDPNKRVQPNSPGWYRINANPIGGGVSGPYDGLAYVSLKEITQLFINHRNIEPSHINSKVNDYGVWSVELSDQYTLPEEYQIIFLEKISDN